MRRKDIPNTNPTGTSLMPSPCLTFPGAGLCNSHKLVAYAMSNGYNFIHVWTKAVRSRRLMNTNFWLLQWTRKPFQFLRNRSLLERRKLNHACRAIKSPPNSCEQINFTSNKLTIVKTCCLSNWGVFDSLRSSVQTSLSGRGEALQSRPALLQE